MQLNKKQKEKFVKLNINSFIELTLLTPYSYEDLRLHDKLQEHKFQLIDATVESVFRSPNSIQITFFAHNFGHSIVGVLFRPKPYMIHQFKVGDRDYYFGNIECKVGQCSMSMPKKITNIGSITPRYKCALRSDVMLRFIQENLNKKALHVEGLKDEIIENILKLHFPKDSVPNLKDLDAKTLHALKYIELFLYMKQLRTKRRYFKSSTCRVSEIGRAHV